MAEPHEPYFGGTQGFETVAQMSQEITEEGLQTSVLSENPTTSSVVQSSDNPYLNSTQQFSTSVADESTFAIPKQTQPFSQLPQDFLEDDDADRNHDEPGGIGATQEVESAETMIAGTQPFSPDFAEADQIIGKQLDMLQQDDETLREPTTSEIQENLLEDSTIPQTQEIPFDSTQPLGNFLSESAASPEPEDSSETFNHLGSTEDAVISENLAEQHPGSQEEEPGFQSMPEESFQAESSSELMIASTQPFDIGDTGQLPISQLQETEPILNETAPFSEDFQGTSSQNEDLFFGGSTQKIIFDDSTQNTVPGSAEQSGERGRSPEGRPEHVQDGSADFPTEKETENQDDDDFAPKSPSDAEEEGLGDFAEREGSPGSEGPKSPAPEEEEGAKEGEGDDAETSTGASQRRRVILSDDEDDGEAQAGSRGQEGLQDENEGQTEEEAGEKGDDEKSEVGELIADIFGESDAEGGSDDEGKKGKEGGDTVTADDDDVGRRQDFEWDFDVMLRNKKAEARKHRSKRRKDGTVDLLSDADEQIKDLVYAMKEAASRDRELNAVQQPALNKRKMLPHIVNQLRKADLQEAYVDFGVVEALSEWLAPLPDKSLPSLEIRTQMLKLLTQFPKLDQSILRRSGIGKAIMLLFKHPREIKENKTMAGKLISDWSRPIFELDTDYRALSKKDREARDYQNMPLSKKRKLSLENEESKAAEGRNEEEERPLRPGDKGWIGRARVPQPSTRDYVVRPKWKVEGQFRGSTGKKSTIADKKIREFKDKTKGSKTQHAVSVSLEGRKMAI